MEQSIPMTSNDLPQIVSSRSLLDIRRTCPRYRNIPAPARREWLSEQIIYCNAINHQTPDAKMVLVDTAALDEAIVHDPVIGDFTQPEIVFAMYHGAMGEYGDFYGLTARTFMGFFREFTRTDVKFNATFQERKALEPPRGSWVLQRMEYQRQQVEAERALREAAEEDTPVDRAAITRTIMDAQSRK